MAKTIIMVVAIAVKVVAITIEVMAIGVAAVIGQQVIEGGSNGGNVCRNHVGVYDGRLTIMVMAMMTILVVARVVVMGRIVVMTSKIGSGGSNMMVVMAVTRWQWQ